MINLLMFLQSRELVIALLGGNMASAIKEVLCQQYGRVCWSIVWICVMGFMYSKTEFEFIKKER